MKRSRDIQARANARAGVLAALRGKAGHFYETVPPGFREGRRKGEYSETGGEGVSVYQDQQQRLEATQHQLNDLIEQLIECELRKRMLEPELTALGVKIAELREKIFIPAAAPPSPPPPNVQEGSSMEIATRIVRDHVGPISIAALAELGGLSERQARGCISALLRAGTVKRVEEGGYELVSNGAAGA